MAELEAHGPALGRPLVDTLRHTRLPIRPPAHRDPPAGGDKAGRWAARYRALIPEAERLYEEHLARLRREGELD